MTNRLPRLNELPDEELMAMYARDEESAFEVLLARYRKPLFGFLFRYLGRPDKAEDVFQDVFYEVVRARKSFRPDSKFSYWLFRIARNRAVDRLRRNGFREMESLDQGLYSDGEEGESRVSRVVGNDLDPEESASQSELEDCLQECLAGLPPEQREVFWLKEQSGLTFAEIAEMTGVSQNTVKSRLRYALEKIRGHLTERGFKP